METGESPDSRLTFSRKDFFFYHNCIIRLARFRGIDKRGSKKAGGYYGL